METVAAETGRLADRLISKIMKTANKRAYKVENGVKP